MTSWGRRVLAMLVTVAVVGSCIDLGGPAVSGVASISDLRVPYPSVVIGDIMRDSLGAPAPLGLTAYDASGSPLPSEPISYFAVDSTITVDSNGLVRGVFRDTAGARVTGGAGTLQTLTHRIFVTPAPVTATRTPGVTEIDFDSTAVDSTNQTNWSPPLSLMLAGSGTSVAQGFVVTYTFTRTPVPFAPGLSTVYLADDIGRASSRDTTDFLGIAARRVIVRPLAIDSLVFRGRRTDTIGVRATVKYLGIDVPGSPIDFIIPLKKKP